MDQTYIAYVNKSYAQPPPLQTPPGYNTCQVDDAGRVMRRCMNGNACVSRNPAGGFNCKCVEPYPKNYCLCSPDQHVIRNCEWGSASCGTDALGNPVCRCMQVNTPAMFHKYALFYPNYNASDL